MAKKAMIVLCRWWWAAMRQAGLITAICALVQLPVMTRRLRKRARSCGISRALSADRS